MTYDFVQLLKDNHIQFTSQIHNGWVNIRCPLACGDQGAHGGFNLAGGWYNCFKCGGHNVEYVIKKLLGVSSERAAEILKQYSGYSSSLRNKLNKKKIILDIQLPGGPLEEMHKKYLLKRKFDPDFLAEKYGIQGEGITGDWKFRVIIPIIYLGRTVSFQGRDITGKAKLRYITLSKEKSIIDPKNILYNLDNCKKSTILLVEGVFDCWRIGDDCAATLGTSMTENQIALLTNKYKRIIFLFDPEKTAQKRAVTFGKSLYDLGGYGATIEKLDTELDHDPGDMTKEEVKMVKQTVGLL